MEINKAAVGAVAGICLLAGMGGAYVLTRGSASSAPTATIGTAATGVESSEAVISEPSTPTPAVPEKTSAARTVRPEAPAQKAAAGPVARSASSIEPMRAPDAPRDTRPATVTATEAAVAPAPEPAPAAPATPLFEELVVSADSVIGLQMESSVTSEHARIEDQVTAQVTRDLRVGDRVAIPAGSKAYGEVTLVERGGRMRERARLGVRFTSIVLGDGSRVPIETDAIIREGSSPTGESTAKIGGGALGGAIIGGILGGARGAIIGGSTGAGAGTAAVLAGGRNPATLTSGTPVTARLLKPVAVTVDK